MVELFRKPWFLAMPSVLSAVLAVNAFVEGRWLGGVVWLVLAVWWAVLARSFHRTNQARKQQRLTP
jgi:hypothetical protein